MNKKIFVAALALALAAPTAFAANVSAPANYTFAEAGYQYVDADGPVDADGAYLRASYNFGQTGFYGFAKAGQVQVDDTNFDVRDYELGAGYHRALGSRVDGFVEVAGIRTEADGGFDADGYRVGAGVKVDLTERLEGLVQANYRDGNDAYGETTGVVGVKYAFNDRWSMVGNAEVARDGELYNVGVRYSF